ncbi:MAG TPA: lipoyl(octanoyl) transferase LipB [Burkholderiales bacterium]|nr:lipoyl(octanoyl) transferase LipB [Burkholderiales bacterium]
MQTAARSISTVIPAQAGIQVGKTPIVRHLGLVEYVPTYQAMRRFIDARGMTTPDELWVLEHPPVYTVGIAGREKHFPRASAIPIERIDRGGQITYHGPGQAIVYTLVDLARRGLTVRAMVTLVEQAVIDTLREHDVNAERKSGAPGVYVDGAKIAALGLRVRRGCCYHGVALNVDMDLGPFSAIDPCGYPGLQVTQTSAHGVAAGAEDLGEELAGCIAQFLEEK